jgi:hypothetical protein
MDSTILAHGNGLDELLIFASPLVMGLGLWLIVRQKPDEEEGGEDPPGS